MSKKILPEIRSLGQLRKLAAETGDFGERYRELAIRAATNLGGLNISTFEKALRHLNNEADATDSEEGVVNEVNFCRRSEAADAG